MAQSSVKNDFARLALERLERSRAAYDTHVPFAKDYFGVPETPEVDEIQVGIVEDPNSVPNVYDSWFAGHDEVNNNIKDTTEARVSKLSRTSTPRRESVEQSFHRRGRSITFDSEATLDDGERRALDAPLPHVTDGPNESSLRQQQRGQQCHHDKTHSTAHDIDSLVDENSPASSPLMLAQRHRSSECGPHSTHFAGRRHRSVTPNFANISPRHDGMTTAQSPFEQSLTAMSSPVFTPLPDPASPEPWTLCRQGSFRSARNVPSSRQTSLRRLSRNGSKPTPSLSCSPASAFLSKWGSVDNMSIPEIDAEGQSFGDNNEFIIGQQLGHGGFGVVKEAFSFDSEGKKQKYAVKIVKKPITAPDKPESPVEEEMMQQLEHEISMWRHLDHRNIIALRSIFESDIAQYCVMDFSNGGTLYELISRSRRTGTKGLDPVDAKSYTFQLACALRYLHQDIRVVHRDVKLENCLLHHDAQRSDQPGLLRLADFGLSDFLTIDSPTIKPNATISNNSNANTPDTGNVTGSLDYVSPETLKTSLSTRPDQDQQLMASVDMWALGVCIFAIVTGERPFQHAMQAQLVEQILAAEWSEQTLRAAPACSVDNQQTPHADDIVKLVRGCLNPDPCSRWTVTQALASPWFADCDDPCT